MERDIESLVNSAKRGNDDAFYELLQLHKEQLYRIAFSYLKNEQDALEAIQETTYRAYRHLSKLKESGFFSTWLIRILLNVCNDEKRKKKRTTVTDVQSSGFHSDDSRTDRIVLLEAIERLESRYRKVVVLKYFEDMTLTEVARVMDRPEGTVKTWLNKALQSLRTQIGKEW